MKYLIAALVVSLVAAGCSSIPQAVDAAQRAFALVKEGDKAGEKGDLDTAIEKYEKALDLAPRAPRHRFAYAQFLYLKGVSYSVASHSIWVETEGRTFDAEIGRFVPMEKELTPEEKAEHLKKSAEYKRKAHIYFNKSLQQLALCDRDYKYAVERVPEAMAMVYVQMEDFNNAVLSFQRVLTSSRVRDNYKAKIREVIKAIRDHQKEVERNREIEVPGPPGPQGR